MKRAYLELVARRRDCDATGEGLACSQDAGFRCSLARTGIATAFGIRVVRVASQLGLRPKELEKRLREVGDRITEKETV